MGGVNLSLIEDVLDFPNVGDCSILEELPKIGEPDRVACLETIVWKVGDGDVRSSVKIIKQV